MCLVPIEEQDVLLVGWLCDDMFGFKRRRRLLVAGGWLQFPGFDMHTTLLILGRLGMVQGAEPECIQMLCRVCAY